MYLTGLTQRERLFSIAGRWFCDQLEPDDGRFVTEVLIYENLISGTVLRTFLHDIRVAANLAPLRPIICRLSLKDELREAIIASCKNPSRRAATLFRQFRESPEEFFPRTPADLLLALNEDGALGGMIRIKRIRRVADKASRRVADALAFAIRTRAQGLAEGRARSRGVPLEQLYSSADDMLEDFAAAEQIVSRLFQRGEVRLEREEMRIDDVLGCKFVGTEDELAAIVQAIDDHPQARIVEWEEHRGSYNDTNLLVDLELPPDGQIIDRLRGYDWRLAEGRGLTPEALASDLPGYVESGANTVRCEIILTTLEELIESEFGRSMHEEHILSQRASSAYRGRIARNASYIIEYLLRLAISPTVTVEALPIKMWGRYLQDTFSSAIWQLYGIRHGVALMDSFLPDTTAPTQPAQSSTRSRTSP